MNDADALLAARDLVRERGWVKEAYGSDERGYCMTGALGNVLGIHYVSALESTAGKVLREECGDRYGCQSVFRVNDDLLTEAEQACALLESAAKRAAE